MNIFNKQINYKKKLMNTIKIKFKIKYRLIRNKNILINYLNKFKSQI